MNCSPPGSSVHRIFQARILEWVAMPSSRESFHPRIEPLCLTSPVLQADSLPLSHPGSIGNTSFCSVLSLVAQTVKGLPAMRRRWFDPWVGKIPWRRKWKSTPVLMPGKSHGQGSLVGYSLWGRKESDTTERLHFHFQLLSELTCLNQVLMYYWTASEKLNLTWKLSKEKEVFPLW